MTTTTPAPATREQAIRFIADRPSGWRFKDADVTPALAQAASEYITDYTGSFAFIRDLRATLIARGSLSIPQLRGALNCMLSSHRPFVPAPAPVEDQALAALDAADGRAAAKPMPVSAAIPLARVIADGYYTVSDLPGHPGHVTLRISPCEFGDFRDGRRVIATLTGQDNETDYTGWAFLTATNQIQVWRKFAAPDQYPAWKAAARLLVMSDDERRAAYGEAYALASGRCCRCRRVLTVPASLHRGMGPVCATR